MRRTTLLTTFLGLLAACSDTETGQVDSNYEGDPVMQIDAKIITRERGQSVPDESQMAVLWFNSLGNIISTPVAVEGGSPPGARVSLMELPPENFATEWSTKQSTAFRSNVRAPEGTYALGTLFVFDAAIPADALLDKDEEGALTHFSEGDGLWGAAEQTQFVFATSPVRAGYHLSEDLPRGLHMLHATVDPEEKELRRFVRECTYDVEEALSNPQETDDPGSYEAQIANYRSSDVQPSEGCGGLREDDEDAYIICEICGKVSHTYRAVGSEDYRMPVHIYGDFLDNLELFYVFEETSGEASE